MCGHGRVDPVQLPYAEHVASGRKNAPLSHQGTNYRGAMLSSTERTSKTKHGDGGNEAREREKVDKAVKRGRGHLTANKAVKIEGWELRHRQGVNIF